MSRATDAAAVDSAWTTLVNAVNAWVNNNGASPGAAASWMVAAMCFIRPEIATVVKRMVVTDPTSLTVRGQRSFAANDTNNSGH